MEHDVLVNTLNNASHTFPFAELGINTHELGGVELTVWLPNALEVTALTFKDKKTLVQLTKVDKAGLFKARLEQQELPFNYRLNVSYADETKEIIDPYQFKEEAYHAAHYIDSAPENIYRQLGAQLVEVEVEGQCIKGTRFAVFAPNAQSCSLIGEFNLWDGRALPMQKTNCGHFVLFVPGVKAGCKY